LYSLPHTTTNPDISLHQLSLFVLISPTLTFHHISGHNGLGHVRNIRHDTPDLVASDTPSDQHVCNLGLPKSVASAHAGYAPPAPRQGVGVGAGPSVPGTAIPGGRQPPRYGGPLTRRHAHAGGVKVRQAAAHQAATRTRATRAAGYDPDHAIGSRGQAGAASPPGPPDEDSVRRRERWGRTSHRQLQTIRPPYVLARWRGRA
jgi:hypothetical protein